MKATDAARPVDRERLDIIDQLRGLAAFSVAWYHIVDGMRLFQGMQGNNPLYWSASLGWLGVDIFFVISGFVIPYSISRAFPDYSLASYPRFLSIRLTRIELPYLASIALIVAIGAVAMFLPGFKGNGVDLSVGRIAAHFLYLIPFTHYEWIQAPYWTLGYEFAYYLSIGLLFLVICGRGQKPALLVTALVLFVLIWMFKGNAHDLPRAALFIMGIGVFRLRSGVDKPGFTVPLVIATALFMAAMGNWREAISGSITALLIARNFRIADYAPWLARALATLGVISYSLYLVHTPIATPFTNRTLAFLGRDMTGYTLASFVSLAACLAFATFFWWAVEGPAMRLSRRFKPGGRKAEVEASGLQEPLPEA